MPSARTREPGAAFVSPMMDLGLEKVEIRPGQSSSIRTGGLFEKPGGSVQPGGLFRKGPLVSSRLLHQPGPLGRLRADQNVLGPASD